MLSCKHSEIIFGDRNMPLTCGNVELRGLEPLASCMPCNASSFPAWASMAPTWTYCAQECLGVPPSLYGMAVHLAVRRSLIAAWSKPRTPWRVTAAAHLLDVLSAQRHAPPSVSQ